MDNTLQAMLEMFLTASGSYMVCKLVKHIGINFFFGTFLAFNALCLIIRSLDIGRSSIPENYFLIGVLVCSVGTGYLIAKNRG